MGNSPPLFRLNPSQYKPGSAVLVQGASGGLGQEITKIYAGRGCPMVITGRNEQALIDLQKLCQDQYSNFNIHYIVGDCTIEQDCQKIVNFMIEKCERIDIMVLAAGVAAHARFADLKSVDLVRQMFDANFYSYIMMTRSALPHLRHNKGQVLVVSSMSGQLPIPYRAAYCASKHALHGFFDTLFYEEAGNLDVTMFCPSSLTGSNFRKNSLTGEIADSDSKNAVSVEDAAFLCIQAADRRIRNFIVPLNGWLLVYLHQLYPDGFKHFIFKNAKL